MRSVAAIFSPLIEKRERVSNQLIHIADWLPTFASAAGIDIDGFIDGENMWNVLSEDLPSPRKELLVHLDPESPPYMAYISDMVVSGSTHRFKIVNGTTFDGLYDEWLSPPIDQSQTNSNFGKNYSAAILTSATGQVLSKYSNIHQEFVEQFRSDAQITCNGHTPPKSNSILACNALISPCLFDILNDPCETTNLASLFPKIVKQLQVKLDYYRRIAQPPRNKPANSQLDPSNFNGTWTWWDTNEDRVSTKSLGDYNYSSIRILVCALTFIYAYSHLFANR